MTTRDNYFQPKNVFIYNCTTNIVIFIRHLRTGYGGLLRMNPAFADYGLKDLLPLRLKDPDEGCTRVNRTQYCFDAGICL